MPNRGLDEFYPGDHVVVGQGDVHWEIVSIYRPGPRLHSTSVLVADLKSPMSDRTMSAVPLRRLTMHTRQTPIVTINGEPWRIVATNNRGTSRISRFNPKTGRYESDVLEKILDASE